MTELPLDELTALGDLLDKENKRRLILELGDKANSTGPYRDYYDAKGHDYACLDWNGRGGAIQHDMRQPVPVGLLSAASFEIVTNFGFTEHVTEQEPCWANINEIVAVDGWLCFCTPAPHQSWSHHGYWHPSVDWYKEWASLNGYMIELAMEWTQRVRPTVIGRLRKLEHRQHQMPTRPIKRSRLKFTERDLNGWG